jgi:hypothetical protein|tara:strand:- start:1444 stop:1866 length:423 start_codon:yes stop_codon:yes gene_type:complete
MKAVIAIVGTVLFCTTIWSFAAHATPSNDAMKQCLAKFNYTPDQFDTFDWSKAAGCHSDYRTAVNKANLEELKDFLKHNPRYRVPGQSMNRCWGKPREMPFESAYIERNGDGFKAGVSYKDTMPAGCYENAPWDNRDLND